MSDIALKTLLNYGAAGSVAVVLLVLIVWMVKVLIRFFIRQAEGMLKTFVNQAEGVGRSLESLNNRIRAHHESDKAEHAAIVDAIARTRQSH